MNRELYQSWVKSIFDREESEGDWRFDLDNEPLEIPDELVPEFVAEMCNNYYRDLVCYSDWQLGMGVDYIFNCSCSDYAFALKDEPAPLDVRIDAIKSIKNLYKDCFYARYEPVLGYLSEPGNKLNDICYMFWDVTPITYCKDNPNREQIYDAAAEVMEFSLILNNIACIESSLHGLGHLVGEYDKAKNMIELFIANSQNIDLRLIKYANDAKTGYIQ